MCDRSADPSQHDGAPMTPEQIALPARAVSTEAGDRLLAMQSHRDRATVEWLTNDIRAIEQEEFDRTMSAVRAYIDTLTADEWQHPDNGHDHWYTCIRCGVDNGVNDRLARIDTLTAAVEALPFVPDEDTEGWEWVSRSDVLAILNGETP